MTVYSYARTSEVEVQGAEQDIEALLEQENLKLQTYALGHGMRVGKAFVDEKIKWTTDFGSRKQAKLLLDRLEAGDIVLAVSIERIFSSCTDMVETVALLREKQARLLIVELGGDVTDPAFAPSFDTMLGTFQRLEKRRSTERIKTVKRNQRNKGRFLGGSRPFGYMVHSNGSLIENPMEQRVLQKIIQMKKKGKSLRAISAEVSTPMMPVSFKTVQRLLKRHEDIVNSDQVSR